MTSVRGMYQGNSIVILSNGGYAHPTLFGTFGGIFGGI